jgi:HD-GYP domain-containing protein (c-di-GMP phosphodiesterase class II)
MLTEAEHFDRQAFKTIKQHPIVGRDLILEYTIGSQLIADVIAQEHERDDGLGYPNYLTGDQIHLYAKIIAVCDVFEALCHKRSYRRAMTPEQALFNVNAFMVRRTVPAIITALGRAIFRVVLK